MITIDTMAEKAELLKDETLTFIPGMSSIRVKDLQSGVVTGNLESIFAQITRQMGKVLPRASVVIASAFEELSPDLTSHLRSTLNRFLCIGPFGLLTTPTAPHLPPPSPPSDPYGCIPWLDRQPPQSVIYIAFGTFASPTAAETAAIAAALEEVGVGFLWSMKAEKMSDLPDTFVKMVGSGGSNNKGLIVPWCPQIEVLKHRAVGASMTHFGWGSVMESLNEGVPLIGRPFVGDNGVIARLAEAEWGAGVVVVEEGGEFTKDGVVRGLRKVMMDGEDRERIVGNAREFKARIRKAVANGGSSRVNLDILAKIVAQNPLEST